MEGKKWLIIGIIVAFIGIVAYFIFSGGSEDGQGAKTFSGSSGRALSEAQQQSQRDGSRNFQNEMRNLRDKDNAKNKDGKNGNTTIINKITNVTNKEGKEGVEGKEGEKGSNSSINNRYSYTIEGDKKVFNQYSQDTEFAINDGKGEVGDYTKDNLFNGVNGSGEGSGYAARRTSSSLSNLEKTEAFQACLKIVTSILNDTNQTYGNVQTALTKLAGFKLLPKVSQDSFINDLATRKYENNANKYCSDIISAIENAFGNLEIYKQCIETVGKILAKANPAKNEIKILLADITGFSLLPELKQTGFVNDLYSKKYADNAKLYCIDIVSSIAEAMNDLAIFKQCVTIVTGLLTQPSVDAQTVKSALTKLTGFAMIAEEEQQKFVNSIVSKAYGDNAARYCMEIVSAILDATDRAALYKLCVGSMNEILKERLAGTEITEELILTKLSLMRIFNGVVDNAQRKVIAQSYFSAEYDNIIADIKTLNSVNFDKKAQEICAKIVSSVIDSVTGENVYGECILALNQVKQSNNQSVSLVDIIPSIAQLDFQSQHTIENMFKSFLQGSSVAAEEICTFIVQELASEGGMNEEGDSVSASDDSTDKDAESYSSDSSQTENPCVTLMGILDSEYQESVSNPGGNYIQNITSKIPAFEFYIPETSKALVIQSTILKYLSKPVTDSAGKTYHRDETHQMNDEDMELFSQLSLHERSTIAERLYSLAYTMFSGSENYVFSTDVQTEVYPNLCKCSHPDFDDGKWQQTVTNYFSNKEVGMITSSLPNDEIQKALAISSSPFYSKCTTSGISTLSSSDTTSSAVFEKMKANLPELAQIPSVTEDDVEPLICHATDCQGGNCSLSCEQSTQSVCESLTEKYLTQVPQNKPLTNDQIFACEADTSNSYNLIYLHCLETAMTYYSATSDKETFLSHCQKAIGVALEDNQNNPNNITIAIIKDYLASTSNEDYAIFTNLLDGDKQRIASDIYDKIQRGEINYNQTIEKSCYQLSSADRYSLGVHFSKGMDYFIEDASAIREAIIEELWDLNEKERMMKNRSITYDKCIEVADLEWKKVLMGSQTLRAGKKEDLALPPSPQCKCYIQKIFLTLHGKAIKDADECAEIAGQISSDIDQLTALSQKSSSGLPSTSFYKIVSLIPHFDELPYNVKTEVMQAISSDLAQARADVPTTSKTDIEILLSSAQKNTHCTTIETHVEKLTAAEKDTCVVQLGKVSYLDTKAEGSNSNNLICNLFGESLKKASDDTGQMNAFPSDNDQLHDIRLSTCTQKLRAVYMQIEAMQASYWEDSDYNWTLDSQCSQQSGYIIDINAFAEEQFNSSING